MENLAGMIVFARVVEAQSFSEAGRRLGMSPSVVSKHIARLEKSLGTRLLNRTTRKLSLTEVGEAVYEHCTRIAHEAEEVEFAVAHLQSKPRGRLRVSAPWTFGMLHMGPVIAGFLRRYPEVEVDLTCRDSVAVDLVEDGLDAAMVLAPAASENVVARQLAPIRWVLCASPAYLAEQPVIGLWPASAAAVIDAILRGEGRHSMRAFAEAIGARAVQAAQPPANINTPQDLAEAEKRHGL